MFGNAQVGALRVSLGLDNAQFLQGSKQAQTAFKGLQAGMQQTARSAGQARASMANLGQQIGDVAQGLGSGIRPMQIFAQQAGQVAFAMSGLGGVAGRIGTFLSGPFGAAILGVTILAGNLAAAFFNSRDAADASTDALESKKTAVEQSRDAMEQLNRITGLGVKTEEQQARELVKTTQAQASKTVATYGQIKAQLILNEELRKGIAANIALTNDNPEGALLAFGVAGIQGDRLAKELADVEKNVRETFRNSQQAVRNFEAYQAGRRVAAQLDPAVGATQRLEAESARLFTEYSAGKITLQEYERRLLAVRQAAEAAKAATRSNGRGARQTRDVLGEGVASILATAPTVSRELSSQSEQIAGFWADFDGSTRTIQQTLNTIVNTDMEGLRQQLPDLSAGLGRAFETAQTFGENLSRGLGQALVFGQSLGDALVNSIKAAAAELITSGLLDLLTGGRGGGGGLLGGLVGGLFGIPGFANGTNNAPGGLAMVGERGRELVRLPKGSQVLPNPDTERLMRGGGQERFVFDVQPSPLFVTTVRRTTQETAAATVNAAMRGNRRMKLAGAV